MAVLLDPFLGPVSSFEVYRAMGFWRNHPPSGPEVSPPMTRKFVGMTGIYARMEANVCNPLTLADNLAGGKTRERA